MRALFQSALADETLFWKSLVGFQSRSMSEVDQPDFRHPSLQKALFFQGLQNE
jgi:hypothetical protein